ncbi:unnamed protein product [Rhizophagus irregularis]|nr:unnamed protein product [Rhizophagus irregularis]
MYSGRLDDEFRNEPVPDVWIVKFETSRNAGRNFWVKDPRLRLQDEISKLIFRSPSVRKNFEGSRGAVSTFRRLKERKNERERFDGSLDIPEFNISKVWWFLSLNVWNLTFRRFSPASTSASDI